MPPGSFCVLDVLELKEELDEGEPQGTGGWCWAVLARTPLDVEAGARVGGPALARCSAATSCRSADAAISPMKTCSSAS